MTAAGVSNASCLELEFRWAIKLLLQKTFSNFSWPIMTLCGHVFSHRKLQFKVGHPGLDGG